MGGLRATCEGQSGRAGRGEGRHLVESLDDARLVVGDERDRVVVGLELDVDGRAELLGVELLLELEDAVDEVALQLFVAEVDAELLERVHRRSLGWIALLIDEWHDLVGFHKLEAEDVEDSDPALTVLRLGCQ